jgi:hypothetical protein
MAVHLQRCGGDLSGDVGVLERGLRRSDAFVGFQPSGSDRLDEGLMVQLVLVGIALGEVSDRPVEAVAATQVGGDRDGVAGARGEADQSSEG